MSQLAPLRSKLKPQHLKKLSTELKDRAVEKSNIIKNFIDRYSPAGVAKRRAETKALVEAGLIEEKPRFAMFEDHFYPNSNFNRFEHDRIWDPQLNMWAYVAKDKKKVKEYHDMLMRKQSILRGCLSIFSMCTILSVIYSNGLSL